MSRSRPAVQRFLVQFLVIHGHAPSVREIAEGIGRSPSTVHRHLRDLEELGVLRRGAGLARCLVLVPGGGASTDVPLADWTVVDELERQAREFESAADEAEALVAAGSVVAPDVEHALRAACFRGYAHGVRWAAGQAVAR